MYQKIITKEYAQEIALQHIPGQIKKVEIELEDSKLIWEVFILTEVAGADAGAETGADTGVDTPVAAQQQTTMKVVIDASTGLIVKVKEKN